MKSRITITLTFALLVGLVSCTTTDRLVDGGEYEKAVARIANKLEGKDKKKTEDVKLLERAFNRANAEDMREIELLSGSANSANLERALSILRMVERRQQILEPFIPLVSKDGYRARFELADIHGFRSDLQAELSDALATEAGELMSVARLGDREAGRLAYSKYDKLLSLAGNSSELRTLKDEARRLGITTMAVSHEVNDYLPYASYLDGRLNGLSGLEESTWINVIGDSEYNNNADYQVNLYVRDVRLGPNNIRNEETTRTKTVSDGWDYVLDQNGNVLKDSTGNDIKVERKLNVRGVAVRTIQEREAQMEAIVEVTDLRTNRIVYSRPVEVKTRFTHTGRSYYGDARALWSSERVFEGLVNFPDDLQMIDRLLNDLRPAYNREVSRFLKSFRSV